MSVERPSAPRARRELGATGLLASPIGLGLAALGRPAYINLHHGEDLGDDRSVTALRERAHEVLDAAFDHGVRYFDAARSYGRAEEFLAAWLERRGLAPGDVVVGSKWGYEYTGGWRLDAERHEVKDLSLAMFRRQLAETRSLLGGRFSLYQIHSATLESGVLEDDELLGALAELRATGVAVGLTVTGPEQRATIERALGLGLFDTVQATWNLLERSAEPALRDAHAAGLGVIVKEALANGRLAGNSAPAELVHTSRELAASPDAVALAAALQQPWADVVLSGASTVAQLESNATAFQVNFDEQLERQLSTLTEDTTAYWARRSSLAWT